MAQTSFSKQLFARKPVELFEQDIKNSGLKKVLSKWGLTAMGVGAIIGAGIFVLTGLAAKEHAGPALALSFVVAGIGCTFAALCYAEFASMLPVEGSAYAYSYATMGELFAWIIGWDLILEYAMASASVAVGWSGYLGKLLALFNIHLPLWLMHDYATCATLIADATSHNTLATLAGNYSSTSIPEFLGFHIAFNLPAFLIIAVVTAILVRGVKEAANTNVIMVVIKLAVILFIIVVGAFYIEPSNWKPFIPERIIDSKGIGHYGWLGVLSGASYVFFAYIGFDTVSSQAGEAKNPQKDVPFGIIVSLIVCTILYILVSLVLTGMVNYKDIDITAPISAAFGQRGLNFATLIISFAAVAGLTSVLLVMLLGQSRIFYAMAKDGLLPKKTFGELHTKFKTPYKASIITGIVVGLVSGLTPIDDIAKLVNIGTLLAFVLVCGAVWLMRIKEPNRPRVFKTPFLPLVATLGMLSNLAMMFGLEWINWVRLFGWLAIGCVVYYFYGRKHSVLKTYLENKKTIS
jgi:APA family basic amino acid/polyamine antiporter